MIDNPKINVRSTDPEHLSVLLDLFFATTGIEPHELTVFRYHKKHGIIFAKPYESQSPKYQRLIPGERSHQDAIHHEIERYLVSEHAGNPKEDLNRRAEDRYDPYNDDGIEQPGYRFHTKRFSSFGPNTGGVFAVTPSFGHIGK